MAHKATAERVSADMQPPNYRQAVQTIRHAIVKKKERISSINGEIAGEWGKVEGFKVNKKGGRIFLMLDKMEPDERDDIMRTVRGLIAAAGWPEHAGDLVDAAEQGEEQSGAGDGDTDDDDDDADGGEEAAGEEEMQQVEAALAEPAAKPRRGRRKPAAEKGEAESGVAKSAAEARERARSHLSVVPKSETPAGFTGDNSDLKPA